MPNASGAADWGHYWQLLRELSWTEFKLRDQGTFLGFLWTLLYPALLLGVLYSLFVKWMGQFVDQYAAYLLIGLLFWNFFQKATTCALSSFARRRHLLQNFKFPREIVVLSAIAAILYSFLLELGVLLAFLVCIGVHPQISWLLLPVLVGAILILTAGVSMFLPILAAEYQDLERIWDIGTMALFYLTPVFYPLQIISQGRRAWLMLNPVTQVLISARDCLLAGRISNPAGLTAVVIGSAALFALGLFCLRRCEYHVMDRLMEQ